MVGAHYSRFAPYRGLPPPMQDKRFSADAAERTALAAVYILQGFLDSLPG